MSASHTTGSIGGSVTPHGPIISKFREILSGLKENNRKVVVRGAGWELPASHVLEVEDHICILETPETHGESVYDIVVAQRHFVALDVITSISRDVTKHDTPSN